MFPSLRYRVEREGSRLIEGVARGGNIVSLPAPFGKEPASGEDETGGCFRGNRPASRKRREGRGGAGVLG